MDDKAAAAPTSTGSFEGLLQATIIAAICLGWHIFGSGPVGTDNAHPSTALIALWSHIGWSHLWQNMLLLGISSIWAGRSTWWLFLLGGTFANIVWMMVGMPSGTGASGAVFSVMGFAVVKLWRMKSILGGVAALLSATILTGFLPALVVHGAGLGFGVISGLALWLRGKLRQ